MSDIITILEYDAISMFRFSFLLGINSISVLQSLKLFRLRLEAAPREEWVLGGWKSKGLWKTNINGFLVVVSKFWIIYKMLWCWGNFRRTKISCFQVYLLCWPRTVGKWSKLTTIRFKGMATLTPTSSQSRRTGPPTPIKHHVRRGHSLDVAPFTGP